MSLSLYSKSSFFPLFNVLLVWLLNRNVSTLIDTPAIVRI